MKIRSPRRAGAHLPPAPALDLSQIVRAALGVLDEAGFDGLTMRGLADKLGIKAASLYWHIRGKQELLSLMADEICASVRAPDQALPWKRQLAQLGAEYRTALLQHRDAARVLAASGAPSGPNVLRLTENVLRILLDAGFARREAAYAGALLNDYVVMFVLEETRPVDAEPPPDSGNWLAALPRDEYPSVVALASELMQYDWDDRFRFGTDVLIRGLEKQLDRKSSI